MEEERRSSSSDEEESSSSSGSSDDEIERSSNKRFKSDLISSLPDALIHHILSFLPSTKQAIRTGILSKRWRYQWTRVPVLVLYFSIHSYVPHEEFSQMSSDMQCIVIEQTLNLHDCAKIKKFHLQSDCYLEYNFTEDPVSFAVRKEVQELILLGKLEKFKLPNLVFNVPSLVRLQIEDCTLMPDDGRVNWKHLKDLHVERCCWSNQTIESVVSGSPLLESLEIARCDGFDRLVIASKSLKKLVLADLYVSVLQVSCPNLVEFYAMTRQIAKLFELSDGAIENLLSSSPLLERLELRDCEVCREGLVIDSKSLRKLFLADTNTDALYPVVISCPNIEELHLSSLNFERMKLMNLPSSVCVTIDYSCNRRGAYEIYWGKILEQLHDVKELNIGRCFLTSLSALEITGSGIPSPSINIKCMTFDGGPNFVENLPGIAYGLRLSPELEELVIISQQSKCLLGTWLGDEWPPDDVWVENHWKSNGTIFNCLESHLKIVKIFVLSEDSGNRNCVFNFLEFLLKNAKVLERMVIILENREADFVFEVSQKLLSFPRYSRHTMVELLCSESPRKFMHAYH